MATSAQATSGDIGAIGVTGFAVDQLREWAPMVRSPRLVPTSTVLVVFVVSAVLAGCSDTDRSAARFCGKLAEELPGLTGPLATSDDIGDLVDRYESLDKITPLAIRDDWAAVTDLVRIAETVDYEDPRSLQDLADAAYTAERSARSVARWAESTCGLAMPDVIGVEGPDTTTIAPSTTSPTASTDSTVAPPATTIP